MKFHLTPSQSSLWFAQANTQVSAPFQCAEIIEFAGDIDPELLATVIETCLSQYPVFTGTFSTDGTGEPVLDCTQQQPIAVKHVDFTDLPDDEAVYERYVASARRAPLHGEALTAHFIGKRAQRWIWLARFHHITADGFAIHALLRWIIACYEAARLDHPLPAAPLCNQDDALHHAQAYAHSAHYDADAAYWQQQHIASCAPRLLPAGEKHVRAEATIEAHTRSQLRDLAASIAQTTGQRIGEIHLLTLLVAHYCAWASGNDTVIMGIPHMNRPLGQRHHSLEPAVTVLPYSYTTNARPILEDLAETTQILEAIRPHSRYRAELIRRAHGLSNPKHLLTGPSVNLRPFSPTLRAGATHATWRTVSVGPINDAEFIFQTQPDASLTLYVFGRTTEQGAHELQQHAKRFSKFAKRAAQLAPEKTLGQIPLLDAEELAELTRFNATETHTHPTTLAALCAASRERALRLFPNQPAIRSLTETWTWQEFYTRLDALTCQLREAGLGPRSLIAIRRQRSPQQFLEVAAAVTIGAAWLPIATELPNQRVAYMLDLAQPHAMLDSGALTILKQPPTVHQAHPQDPAYVLFTSGSTGNPKGVQNNQAAITNRLDWMAKLVGLDNTDVLMQKTACSFDVSVWEFLLPLTHAIPVAIATDGVHKDPALLAAEMAELGVTICHFVPCALQGFNAVAHVRHLQQRKLKLRSIITSGEALDTTTAHTAIKHFGVTIYNLYGPTEAAIDVTSYTVTGTEDTIAIGAPVANTKCAVLDQFQRPVPIGTQGTLYLGGRQLADGYINRPDLTAQRFVHIDHLGCTRWYNTGDTTAWTHQGQLLYFGRNDGQVKLRGQRLELPEIEAKLRALEGIDAAAVALKQVSKQPTLVAYIVADKTTLSATTVREHLTHDLPEYMVPRAYVFLDSLPMTINGKLDTAALPNPTLTTSEYQPPANETEQRITNAWKTILKLEKISVTQNFFDIGGNSLNAVELTVALPQLHVADIFAAPTIRQQAALLARNDNNAHDKAFAPLLELRPHRAGIPIFCFYPAGGVGWAYTGLLPRINNQRGLWAVQSPGLTGPMPPTLHDAAARATADITTAIQALDIDTIDIVGWSLGGVVAQESARLLTQQGITVRTLALMDAYPAETWKSQPTPQHHELLRGLLTMAGAESTLPDDTLTIQDVIAAFQDSPGPFAKLERARLEAIMELIMQGARLMREHTTHHYHGQAHHFTALNNPQHMDPETWQPFITELEIHPLELTHPQLVSPQGLDAVAKILD